MTVNRRNFLRSGAMTAVLAGLALDIAPLAYAQQLQESDPSQDFSVPFTAQQEPTYYFKSETFKPYVKSVFKLRAGANSVDATLISVRDCAPSKKSTSTTESRPTECFVLAFQAKAKLTDLTSIYDVEHGALGNFALFLTYRTGSRGEHFYEAVFNHLL